MAKVIEEGNELVLKLSRLEKLGAFHTSIRAPKNSLIEIKEMANPWSRSDGMKGLRAPGTGCPKVIMLGTLRKRKGKDFAAVYGRGSAKVYVFKGQSFSQWIVSNS
jgi:hypothetical protein